MYVTCKKKFDSRIALEKHNKIHKLVKGTFKCDWCERLFIDEWKLNANKKNHIKHVCDESDEILRNVYSCMKIQTSVMIGKYDAIIEIEDAEECDEN